MAQSKPTGIHTGPIIHKGHTSYVWSLAFAPDGKSVVSGSADGTIRIWDAYSPVAIGQPMTGHTSHVHSVAYSPRSPMIASVGGDHIIRLWDTSTHQQIGTPLKGYPSNVSSIAFSPDGNTLAAGLDETVRLWDVKARTPVSDPFKGHTAWVRAIAFHPDGTRIITGSDDNTVRIWDIERGSTVAGPLQGHTSWIRTIAMSPNGSKMISGSGDGTLRLWDTRSGASIGQPFEGHTNALCCVRFSPNGVYIASGSWDKTVRVWDIRTGRQVDEPFEQHTNGVNSLAFSPNGKYIASGSDDMTVMIWGVSPQVTGQTNNTQDTMEENGDPLKEDSMNAVGRHMSVHDMFRLLSCHGCNDLSLQMDYNQNTAVLVSGGGFGDIWRGDLLDGTRVAIKTWREALIKTSDYKTLKCIEVASGLAYIHSLDMVHGDIKGLNVLVSSDCAAKLTDFGISTMCQSSIVFSATSASQAGSVRWAAPELLSENPVKTKQSDLYALGMTILEVMTGTIPYPECTWDFNVMMKVSQGILPARPASHIQDDHHGNQLWDLLVSCWDRNPDARPSASQIAKSLTLISSLSM